MTLNEALKIAGLPLKEIKKKEEEATWWVIWGDYDDGDNVEHSTKAEAEKSAANDSREHGGAKGHVVKGYWDGSEFVEEH